MSEASDRLEELEANAATQPQLVSPAMQKLNELESAQQAQVQPVQQEPSLLDRASDLTSSISELVTGKEATAALPADVQALPELGASGAFGIESGDFAKDLQISAGLLSTFNPEAQKDIIRNAIPGVEFEQFQDTTVVTMPNGTRTVLNAPGFTTQDFNTALGQVLAFIGPQKLAAFGKNLAQRIGIGGITSGATEAGLQATSKVLGSEQKIDPRAIQIATIAGGVGEVVAPAIAAVRQSRIDRLAKKRAPDEQVGQEGVEAAKKTGIKLFPAQITQDASQLEKQSFIATLPAGAKQANKALSKQNEQAENAVNEYLSSIAPATAIIKGEKRIRSAAQQALAAKRIIRTEKVSPIYTEAFETGAVVERKSIDDLINSKLSELPASGKTAQSIKKVQKLISEAKDLKVFHNVKLEIDDMLSSFGDDSLGKVAKKNVKDIQKELLDQMDAASPGYKNARNKFEELSPEVNLLEDSIIGKIAGVDDTQLKSISGKLFDAAETNPETVRQARKAIVDVDPDAWDDIVRVELEKRMGKVKADITDASATENIPAQLFSAIFGNTKQRRILFNAIDPKTEAGKNLKYLETALKRASKGRPGGSPTATRKEISKELRGGPINWVTRWFKPLETVKGGADDIGFNSRVQAMARALFDPEWKPVMKQIRKLNPNGEPASRAILQLFNDIGESEQEPKEAR